MEPKDLETQVEQTVQDQQDKTKPPSDRRAFFFCLILIFVVFILWGNTLTSGSAKPVIYLYPEKASDVSVLLHYNGTLDYTYPAYNKGWKVTAMPDGTLYSGGKEYSYLFWEGTTSVAYDFSKGFVVKGCDTVRFLQQKLAELGLTPREYNEFIVYWMPKMQNNPYNLIAFQGPTYTDNAVLEIEPKPDSILRVFMAFKPLKAPITIPKQTFQPFERKGFTVVEWGGAELR